MKTELFCPYPLLSVFICGEKHRFFFSHSWSKLTSALCTDITCRLFVLNLFNFCLASARVLFYCIIARKVSVICCGRTMITRTYDDNGGGSPSSFRVRFPLPVFRPSNNPLNPASTSEMFLFSGLRPCRLPNPFNDRQRNYVPLARPFSRPKTL
jgi:hypothetical protein